MLLRFLPLVTGFLPLLGIHASYLIAVNAGRIPSCLPYLDGCTSISATGRYPPASYLFKAVMLPEAVLLILFWMCTSIWLRALESSAGARRAPLRLRLSLLGGGGALALIVYVSFLGTQEPFYEFMRRFGIYFFFLLTVLAQLDQSLRMRRYARQVEHEPLRRLTRLQLVLVALPFGLGVLNLFLKAILQDADRPENAIEWIAVLAMQSHIMLTYFAWRATGFDVEFNVEHKG